MSASVAAKRTGVIRGNCQSNDFATSSAWYCVTFQMEDGSQIELSVDSGTYSVIAEGDSGKLTYQGTRFLSFDRQ